MEYCMSDPWSDLLSNHDHHPSSLATELSQLMHKQIIMSFSTEINRTQLNM